MGRHRTPAAAVVRAVIHTMTLDLGELHVATEALSDLCSRLPDDVVEHACGLVSGILECGLAPSGIDLAQDGEQKLVARPRYGGALQLLIAALGALDRDLRSEEPEPKPRAARRPNPLRLIEGGRPD